ncbi:MAG: sugar phosphate isomerase/epimerase [Prolixibacteraceae bacterium]|jgi:sugar phosphate isomerase/epimerase|nr:sugar phosphate isomerase/epimerase [Prolixibacteraceae bacterium]MBT6765249.1 sugar phosphate isomerase/epimerase [Prolixibacteraceae bacterium]MBT6999387.1 sugar phosphate isomerase/epimerase [Prolixibacteraceae bacterium]MBT7395235.1 sugar phosphate isomerase/epimerase [Prolixibacteraceae bacterium]
METKREFLKKLGLITVGGMVGGSMSPALASKGFAANKNIGLQIYSVGRELTADVPNGLKKIAEIGYNTIELAGYRNRKMGDIEVADYRKLAEDAGLKITGSHVNPPARKYTKENMAEINDFWKQTVEDHVKFGVTSLVQPGMPTVENHDDAALVCEVFNKAGEIAKDANIKWGYHNHAGEFRRIVKEGEAADTNVRRRRNAGDVIYDLFINGTDPGLVFFEMDVYWTVMGANDPLEYFAKYPDRFPILHIKDRKVLGKSGMMNFENIFNKAYENGLDEFYVELEGIGNEMSQFEGVKQCFDYLNNAPFVK